MFETKELKVTKSVFSNLLEQERYGLTIKGLTAEQYKNFQSVTLDLLSEVQQNLKAIQMYIKNNTEYGYVSRNKLICLIYELFMNSFKTFPSRYLLDVCLALIKNVTVNSKLIDFEQKYSVNDSSIENIVSDCSNLRERFIRASLDRNDLLAAIGSEENKAEKGKYLAYQELVSKTHDFFDSSTLFKIATQDSRFLVNFYSHYSYVRKYDSSIINGDKYEQIDNDLKARIDDNPDIKLGLKESEELKQYEDELKEYQGVFERLFNSSTVKWKYSKIQNVLENHDYFTTFYSQDGFEDCGNKVEQLKYALDRKNYGEITNLLSKIINDISRSIFNEKRRITAHYLNSESDSMISTRFVSDGFLYKNATNKEKREMIKDGFLMELFYQCYKGLALAPSYDEDLVRKINYNKEKVVKFVSSLIEIIEREESIQKNVQENTDDIAEYYKYIKSGNQLSEQEVIDYTIKKLDLSC